MNGKFNLYIRLGNAAMQSPRNVAAALREAADEIEGLIELESDEHYIADVNGNTVGGWEYKVHDIHIEDLERRADYEFSSNQRQFIEDALDAGYDINLNYSGRGMYGARCPSITVDGMGEFGTEADTQSDNMGMGYVIYARG